MSVYARATLNLILLVWTPAALAQEEPVFQQTVKEGLGVEAPTGTLVAELGSAVTTGNSAFYQINAGTTGTYTWQKSKLGAIGGLVVGRGIVDADASGGLDDTERSAGWVQTARRYFLDARYDWLVTDRDSLYALVGAFIDPFAGYDLRSHEQLGYSRKLVTNDQTQLVAEVGFDVAQEFYVEGVEPPTRDILAGRIMLGAAHNFNESVGISNTIEVYENILDLEDLRLLNSFSFSAAMSSKVSLKLSHNLIFDNQPVEGFRPLDQTSLATLVVNVL